MLHELRVVDLGVIDELTLLLEPGMTAVTGETGAGKTLIVGAIELLVGGRADGRMVRHGAAEAVVEGRFTDDDGEIVLRRAVPAEGRSRAYVDGSLATAAALADAGVGLVDLHGQHDHQSLLGTAAQRWSLDRFGQVDLAPLEAARKELAAIEAQLLGLGGDERERAREIDLLRFQVDEIEAARLDDPKEDEQLAAEEQLLADSVAHQEAAAAAVAALTTDGGAGDQVATALTAVSGRPPFADLEDRLVALAAELADVTADLRDLGESIEEDPERQAQVRARRQQLVELRRKYGDSLAEVMAFGAEARARLDELEQRDARAAHLDEERRRALRLVEVAEAEVGAARRAAAPGLAAATEKNLAGLAMTKARLRIDVGPDPGDDVTFLLAANPGSPPLPLAKVASGGELARSMLALRLVLTEAPPTLVFDEVDAGVGGAAALAVGRALSQLAERHQVLVVTHLPQVAAFADHQVVVEKQTRGKSTRTTIRPVDGDDRVAELARMLAGQPESPSARRAAADLLADTRRRLDPTA